MNNNGEVKPGVRAKRPRGNPAGRTPKMLTQAEIEAAVLNTLSNRAAARYLSVNYGTYRKYAKMYNLFDGHMNMGGKGIRKTQATDRTYMRFGASAIPLEEILAGKHPHYSKTYLKKRLLLGGYIPEKCALCGFEERRVTDYRVPLALDFIDGDDHNYKFENLRMLCLNCYFLVVGDLKGQIAFYRY